jgi:PAS domain S-box-containing protein
MRKFLSVLAFLEPKKTIAIYLVAVVLLTLLFFIFSSLIDNKAVRDQENAFNLQQALQTLVAGKGIEQHFEDRVRALSVLTEYSLIEYELGLRNTDSLEQLFRIETQTYPEYLSFLYVKSRNDPGFVYRRDSSIGAEAQRVGLLWAWMYFDGVVSRPDKTALWTPPIVVNPTNQLMGLVMPVLVDGTLRGVLVVVEDMKPIIERYIVPMRSGQHGAAYMVDGQGNILYDHETELIGRNIFDGMYSDFPDAVRFNHQMIEQDSGIDEYKLTGQPGGENTRKLIAWYSVLVGGQKLVIALAAPDTEIDTNLTDFRLQRNLLSGALGILLILTSVAFFYSRQQLLEQSAKNLQQLVAVRTHELTVSEEALRSSSELLQALFNVSPLAIIQVDADDRVLLWNPACEQIFGWSPAEILGKTNPIIPQDKFDEYTRIASNLVNGNSYASYETIRQRKDGSIVWVSVATSALLDPAGKLRGRMAIIADISARKKAESEVIERNKELESIGRILKDLAVSLDLSWIIHQFLESTLALTGLESGSIYLVDADHKSMRFIAGKDGGSDLRAVTGSLKSQPGDQLFRYAAETGTPVIFDRDKDNGGTLVTPRDSEDIQFMAVYPLHAEARVIGVLGLFTRTDTRPILRHLEVVTQLCSPMALAIENALLYQKTQTHAGELEQHVRERTVQLENAVHELESFSYSVSHDLRSPLRSISGFSQLLMEEFEGSLDGMARDYLNRIRLSSQRMAQLIDDLLNLARLGRAEMTCQTVNLSKLAQNVVDELSARQERREVKFTIQPDLMAYADLNLMQVVITNLLENAWKFTSTRTHASIEFGASEGEGAPVYYVRDNGAGFDMRYSNKLFGAFQRLHSTQEFEGTGIGLANVQRIIRRHGGRIWAESEPDRGAVFYFTLSGG